MAQRKPSVISYILIVIALFISAGVPILLAKADDLSTYPNKNGYNESEQKSVKEYKVDPKTVEDRSVVKPSDVIMEHVDVAPNAYTPNVDLDNKDKLKKNPFMEEK